MRGYGVARVARILPLFVAVVLLSWVAQQSGWPWLTATAYDIPDIKSLASHLLTLYGVQVLWTIPAELHFYVIFALLWWLRPRLGWAIPAFSVVVLGVFALRRSRTRRGRVLAYAAALLAFGAMYSIARAHHPLGALAPLLA